MSDKTKKILLISSIGLLIVGAIIFWFNYDNSSTNETDDARDTSTADTGQEEEREQSQSFDSPTTVEDTGGDEVEPSGEGQTSNNGTITLFNPEPNQLLSNSAKISGQTEADNIRYRIIDELRGVIAQGQLEVVSGSFSATVSNLDSAGENGIIEVYSVNPSTQVELDSIEINVRFE